VWLGSRVPKAHTHDSAAVAGKGRTRLTSAIVTGKVGIMCQQAAINATTNDHRLLTTTSHGYSDDAT
jgi:hypothetical protein